MGKRHQGFDHKCTAHLLGILVKCIKVDQGP